MEHAIRKYNNYQTCICKLDIFPSKGFKNAFNLISLQLVVHLIT